MKGIFISLLFFFGPLLCMFALRYAGLLLRIWLVWRRQRKSSQEVIDITPQKPHPPSIRFILFAVVVALMISLLVWHRLAGDGGGSEDYVPAHTASDGTLIPGHFR